MLDGSYGLVTSQVEMFSALISSFFLSPPLFSCCGSGCDTHYNAVCAACVFVRISAAQLARTEFSRSLGSVLKNTRATTFLFSPWHFPRSTIVRFYYYYYFFVCPLADPIYLVKSSLDYKGIEVVPLLNFCLRVAHQSRSSWMNPSGDRRILPSKVSGRTTPPTINRCHLVLCSTNSLFSVRCWLTWIASLSNFRRWLVPMAAADACESKTHLGKRGVRIELWRRSASFFFSLPNDRITQTANCGFRTLDCSSLFTLDFCLVFIFSSKLFCYYYFACWRVV